MKSSRARSRSRSYERARKDEKRHHSRRRSRSYGDADSSRSPDRRSRQDKKKNKKRDDSSSPRHASSSPRHASSSPRHASSSKHKKHKHRNETRSPEPPKVKTKEEIRKEKELLKALETPEEKRARRLAKKIQKGKNKKAQMGWDADYMGYTNADNPFGDEHLLDTFMWSKKLEKEGLSELTKDEIEKIQKMKMMENKIELEKVKKRRLEREREKEEREKEQEMLQRDKEAVYFRAWEKQEDSFHLQQAKLRSKIRIEAGRAKPIDLMAHYISLEDDDLAIEMQEPYKYLIGLTIADLEDLLEDIKVYVELEQGKNVSFWRDVTIITEDELNKLRRVDPDSKEKYVVERRDGVNTSVQDDIQNVFKGKTLAQLSILEQSIQKKLEGGEGIDVGYWETLLQQLRVHMARQRLKERHQEELRRKLFKLKMEQGIESQPLFPIASGSRQAPSAAAGSEEGGDEFRAPLPVAGTSAQPDDNRADDNDNDNNDDDDDDEGEEGTVEDQCMEEYDTGGYSPSLIQASDLPPDTLIFDPEEDLKKISLTRHRVKLTGQAERDEYEELVTTAKQGMNAEECQFSVLAPLNQGLPVWSDKYKPRKPRFFNRVHTGFEWNKYNQTHYDIDNPPPKIVQGYKFNIFYPDLIDKTKTPQHYVMPCEDNQDFAILRFHAGPPYEDIAFKIVNKEWEHSYRRGFRCQFYNNIFQLWFHFKRYRYRR